MSDWTNGVDTWIVVIGVLCACSCALLGNFLVLRRISMMGDAISHAVLPGLAVAFLLTGERSSVAMFVGAAVVGVMTALFTQWVHSFGQVDRGASMGVVFTTLFAIGLVLIVQAADHVDLDPGCVLYGSIELAPLDLITVLGMKVPRAAAVLAAVLAIDAACVALLYKELKISAFDPALATTLGINAGAMHYLLMTLVAITTVAAFESIGSILVIAMLIVPAAAAHLLTDRLGAMIAVSLAVAALSAVLGHVAAIVMPPWLGFSGTSTSGMMAVVAGGLFTATMLLAPRHGVLARAAHRAVLRGRILQEDVVALLFRLEEPGRQRPGAEAVMVTPALLAGPLLVRPWQVRVALAMLAGRGWVERSGGGWSLADRGRLRGRSLVRAHRLWESFLHEHLPLPADHVHAAAERLEHVTDVRMIDELAEAMDRPSHDPHGKRIP